MSVKLGQQIYFEEIFFPVTENLKVLSLPFNPIYVQAKVMWIDTRKNLIPQGLSILMKNNENTYKKNGKTGGKSNYIFSITVLYFLHRKKIEK